MAIFSLKSPLGAVVDDIYAGAPERLAAMIRIINDLVDGLGLHPAQLARFPSVSDDARS